MQVFPLIHHVTKGNVIDVSEFLSVIYQLVVIIESWVEMKIKQDNVLGTCIFSITFSDINFFIQNMVET